MHHRRGCTCCLLPRPPLPPPPRLTDAARTRLQFGGGIQSGGGGALKLVRPTYTNSACALGANCGSGCSCDGDDRRGQGFNASLCVGCTCKKECVNSNCVNFYCDTN